MKGCIGGLVRFVLTVALLLVIGIAVAYFHYSPKLEEILADSIRREFMLPPSSTVVITPGSMLDTLEGEVERLYVEATEAKIDGLVVRNLTLLGEGIHINVLKTIITGQAVFKGITHSEISLQVSEEELENRWRAELSKKGLSDVEVTLGEEIGIAAVLDLKVTKIKVSAQGVLTIEEGERIRFTVTHLNLGGAEIGLREMEATFSAMSPLIDLGQLKLNVVVDEVRTGDGMLFVSARSRSLKEKIVGDQESAQKKREADTISKASDEDLLEQMRQLMEVDGEERKQQALAIVEQLKQRGIETGAQLKEFIGQQLGNFEDEYQFVLKELNKLIESQIKSSEDDPEDQANEEK